MYLLNGLQELISICREPFQNDATRWQAMGRAYKCISAGNSSQLSLNFFRDGLSYFKAPL